MELRPGVILESKTGKLRAKVLEINDDKVSCEWLTDGYLHKVGEIFEFDLRKKVEWKIAI
jgi:hypothetical protein